jgi:hypothetical protein
MLYSDIIKNNNNMAKLISTSKPTANKFEIGTRTYWNESTFDGRVFDSQVFYGTVVKVNPKTVDVKTKTGNVYRVGKCDLKLFNADDLFN